MPESEDTLAILFARNPLDLTDENIDRLIEHYRERRAEHIKNPKAKPDKEAVNLADLGLI